MPISRPSNASGRRRRTAKPPVRHRPMSESPSLSLAIPCEAVILTWSRCDEFGGSIGGLGRRLRRSRRSRHWCVLGGASFRAACFGGADGSLGWRAPAVRVPPEPQRSACGQGRVLPRRSGGDSSRRGLAGQPPCRSRRPARREIRAQCCTGVIDAGCSRRREGSDCGTNSGAQDPRPARAAGRAGGDLGHGPRDTDPPPARAAGRASGDLGHGARGPDPPPYRAPGAGSPEARRADPRPRPPAESLSAATLDQIRDRTGADRPARR